MTRALSPGLAVLLIVFTACTSSGGAPDRPPDPPAATTRPGPYPYTTPTPPAQPSVLDGTFFRFVTEEHVGGPGACRRCPPYRLAVGLDVLELDRGVFRIRSVPPSFATVGHFVVRDDRITFFNDPNCPESRGTYAWELTGATVALSLVEDDCAFGDVRSRYVTVLPWIQSR